MPCWNITAQLDRKTGARAGAGNTFEVISLKDDDGNDLTDLVNRGTHFHDLDQLMEAIVRGFRDRLDVTEEGLHLPQSRHSG